VVGITTGSREIPGRKASDMRKQHILEQQQQQQTAVASSSSTSIFSNCSIVHSKGENGVFKISSENWVGNDTEC